MNIKQRAFFQTLMYMLGIFITSGLILSLSTMVSKTVFVGLIGGAMMMLFGYLMYTWILTDLEMKQRFSKTEDNKCN